MRKRRKCGGIIFIVYRLIPKASQKPNGIPPYLIALSQCLMLVNVSGNLYGSWLKPSICLSHPPPSPCDLGQALLGLCSRRTLGVRETTFSLLSLPFFMCVWWLCVFFSPPPASLAFVFPCEQCNKIWSRKIRKKWRKIENFLDFFYQIF